MEIDKDPILERADYMAKKLRSHQVKSVVLMILYDLQIPLNFDGFGYMKNALVIAYRNPTQIVVSEIFEKVGEEYIPKAVVRNIDTAIRDAIKKAWKNRNPNKWRQYLPEELLDGRTPPSNSELISALVYFLELWQDCYEEEVIYERI